MNNTERLHYDLLIDENNDSVHDPKPLKYYMDKWDGTKFIDKMNINKGKSVLEIGVGTGRLAIRIVPFCRWFCGVDISSKTIERAKENLSTYKTVEYIKNAKLKIEEQYETEFAYIFICAKMCE